MRPATSLSLTINAQLRCLCTLLCCWQSWTW